MSLLQASPFGRFKSLGNQRALGDRREVADLAAHKVQELFSYLLLFREYPHPRNVLADKLWGDSSPAPAKQYLRHIPHLSGNTAFIVPYLGSMGVEHGFWRRVMQRLKRLRR